MFTHETFKYFDEAQENKFSNDWFENNKDTYQEFVKNPFTSLINTLSIFFEGELEINPKKISRPVRPKFRHLDKGISKDFSSIIISKEKKSRFDLPPCVHIQFGALEKDNFIKVGMYITNSQQTKKFREHIDFELYQIIENASSFCGNLHGEKYKRTPQILIPALEHLYWYKSFYFCKYFSREEIISKDFEKSIIEFTKHSLPFYLHLNSFM